MSKESQENIFDRLAANPIPGAKKSAYQPEEISETLRMAIHQSGRTVYDIAKAIKIEPDSLYRFLQGYDIRLATADKLAQELRLELKQVKRSRKKQ
jgi:predicted transcriptional regulator